MEKGKCEESVKTRKDEGANAMVRRGREMTVTKRKKERNAEKLEEGTIQCRRGKVTRDA